MTHILVPAAEAILDARVERRRILVDRAVDDYVEAVAHDDGSDEAWMMRDNARWRVYWHMRKLKKEYQQFAKALSRSEWATLEAKNAQV